jgi:SH3-like domain-containing protein
MVGEKKIVVGGVVHLHAEPSYESERVSQTLLGRFVTVLEVNEAGTWARVEGRDGYSGWAETRWLADLSRAYLTLVTAIFAEVRTEPRQDAPIITRLPILCKVIVIGQEINGWQKVRLPGNGLGWMPSGALVALPEVSGADAGFYAAQRSRDFLGTPYLWGGVSSFGVDCSGLVQLCYYLSGVTLRRDADIQRDDPRFVPVEKDDLHPGDLVFFGKPERITHVGMQVEKGTFIHAVRGAGVVLTEWGQEGSLTYVDARRLVPSCLEGRSE